jgi:hypothetical protein
MSRPRIALGTRKGIMILEKRDSWSIGHYGFRGSHVSMVHCDRRSGHLYACLDDGHFGNKLFRWDRFWHDARWSDATREGVWKELPAAAYPAGSKLPNGEDAVLTYQWAFAHGLDDQPGRIYLGTEPGGLFVSDDDGDHWCLVQSLWDHPDRCDKNIPWMGGGRDHAAIHSICVDPRDSGHVRVGISVAGVYGSTDHLQTWQALNRGLRADYLPNPESPLGHDPHLLVQCLHQPDILWQQNHCGIFRSVDCGQSWQCVSEAEGIARFGFCIAVDPHNGDNAWVVPAESDQVRIACHQQLAVSRTEDGGRTWLHFRNGLPREDCFDFAFRHALVQTGDWLVFGTAGGSLYESRDRGESWTAVFHHLPPVYCVHVIQDAA